MSQFAATTINRGEDYRSSHPVEGGDACLSLAVHETVLEELVPKAHQATRTSTP